MKGDLFGFPALGDTDVQIFNTNGGPTGATGPWQVWHRPPGANMTWMLCIGGGGSGAGGQTAAAASARTGGGGGGCSAVARLSILTALLPDRLYLQVGVGGASPAGNGAGNAGSLSYVSAVQASITAANLFLISGNAAAGGGAVATTGGAAGTIAATTSAILSTLGSWTAVVGIIGAAGGANTGANGVAVTALGNLFISPGAGGGGTPVANTDFAGGAITGAGLIPTIAGGLATGGAGGAGVTMNKPFMSCGGSGGGTNGASGVGGAGGNAGIGSGGGGGGGGVTGGAGGRGGDGLIIIVSW